MIGQSSNKQQIKAWKENDNLPRTLIITGSRGSGKRTLSSYIAEQFGFDIRWIGNKVNDVRDMITDCRSLSKPTLFVFVGADDMSLSAKNSLLKVTEEPPNDAYFIIPLEDISNTLPTIRSRAVQVQMEPYAKYELWMFTDNELCAEIATNPGEVKELEKMGVENLVENVEKVVDNILKVGPGNALNTAKFIKFKEEDDGYGAEVFLRVFVNRIVHRVYDNIEEYSFAQLKKYTDLLLTTQKYLNFFNNPSLNKRSLFDMWIFEIRKEKL